MEKRTDFKAKIQLASSGDYMKLLSILNSPTIRAHLIRITVLQDYVLDGIGKELWNNGLTLAIRQTKEQFPVTQHNQICTVSLKESIFRDLVDTSGHLLSMSFSENEQPYYEVRETEEKIHLTSIQEVISGAVISPKQCNSQIINDVIAKHSIPNGIRCIGSFINLRHTFHVDGLPDIEIDKCRFPHGEGFFMRFPPDDVTMTKVLEFIQFHKIQYSINLQSKTALFFLGLPDITADRVLNQIQPSLISPALVSTSPLILPDEIIPIRSASPTIPQLPATRKRGRKSLVEKVVEKVRKEKPVSPKLPDTLETTLESIEPDAVHDEEMAHELVKKYQQKKNQEASARYRKRRNDEITYLRQRVGELEEEVKEWKRKYEQRETAQRDEEGIE